MLIDSSKHFSSISSGWLLSMVFLVKLLYQNLLSSLLRKTQELEIMKTSGSHFRWIDWVIITEKMSLHALFSHLPFFQWWWLSCNKFHMLEMEWFFEKIMRFWPNQAAEWSETVLRWRRWWHIWCCTSIFHGRGDAVAAAEIIMVRKCFDAMLFWPVDTGMFFMNA